MTAPDEFTAWLAERAWRDGFAAGVEHARAAMDTAIREAIDPGPDVNPYARAQILDRTAKDVVLRLIQGGLAA